MSNKTDRYKQTGEVCHFAKLYKYPCGVVDIISSTSPVFRESGWEDASWGKPGKHRLTNQDGEDDSDEANQPEPEAASKETDIQRSMRRARSRVRRLALSNDFKWFVTLTLSPEKVDRYDAAQVVRKLNNWCSNQVKRRGLKYILVPERHKDGAIHFHGFFSDALEAVASGHRDKHGHMIYNLPGWALGFTAAIECYGDYAGAVAYVCKYIGKQGDKPAGRWYYSGGDLRQPVEIFGEISPRDLQEEFGERVFVFNVPGAIMAVCNGIKVNEAAAHEEPWDEFGKELEIDG